MHKIKIINENIRIYISIEHMKKKTLNRPLIRQDIIQRLFFFVKKNFH